MPEAEWREARETGQAPAVRWHLRKAGQRIFIEGVVRPLTAPDGRLQGFLKVGQDVTERRATEERLRTLMEGIPQLVWRRSLEGQWTWSGPQWRDFTGQGPEQSQGRGWLGAVHPDDHARVMDGWDAARPHGLLDVEYRLRRAADGAWLRHHTRSVPVRDAAGEVVEWLDTSMDVQVLKALQERQALLVPELQHRTRNLIAVVRSIAAQSMAATESVYVFGPSSTTASRPWPASRGSCRARTRSREGDADPWRPPPLMW